MNSLTVLFAAAVALAAALAWISVSMPRPIWAKLTVLLLACLQAPVVYLGMTELLGRPKPVALEWLSTHAPGATVLASSFAERQGIYLWLQVDGAVEPQAYVLPWDQQLAEQLQAAAREAAGQRTSVRMRQPFEPSLDDAEPRFYAEPQPALPEKQALPLPPSFTPAG